MMEQMNKRLPHIILGAAVLGAGLYLYSQSGETKARVPALPRQKTVRDLNKEKTLTSKDTWPVPRRIIDGTKSIGQQQRQLQQWINLVLNDFLKKHGPFITNENHILEEKEFMNIYDLMETQARFKLYVIRKENEQNRREMFHKSFSAAINSANATKDQTAAEIKQLRKDYVEIIYTDMNKEIELYGQVQEEVLKQTKINQQIWETSMEHYLPAGEQFIRKALRQIMSSPFTFHGEESEEQIVEVFQNATSWALETITKKAQIEDGEFAVETNFQLIIHELLGEDIQDNLLIMDYLFIDYCLETANLDSAMIKSAISAYELEQKPMVNSWIQNVVDAFTK